MALCTNAAVDVDAKHWAKYWQLPPSAREAHVVLQILKSMCVHSLRYESQSNSYDMPIFPESFSEGSLLCMPRSVLPLFPGLRERNVNATFVAIYSTW